MSVQQKLKTALQWQKEAAYPKKAQLIDDQRTAFTYGGQHDSQLFKEESYDISEHIRVLADAGYQGLAGLHQNSQTLFKKSKYHALTKKEEQRNRALARKRILIEHIFAS